MVKQITVKKISQFSGHTGSIYTALPSKDSDKIYTAGADGNVVEWDLTLNNDGRVICRVPYAVYSLLFVSETNQLLIGTATGNLHVVNLGNNIEAKNMELHKGGLFDMQIAGNTIITAGGDGCIGIIDIKDLVVNKLIKISEKSVRAIAVSRDQLQFAVGFSDHKIRVFNSDNFKIENILEDHTNSVFALSYDITNEYLLSGGRDATLKRWAVKRSYKLINSVIAHNLHINSIVFDPAGSFFITSSMDKTIKIWDAQSFELIKVIDKERYESHQFSINKIIWLKNNQFASVGDDKKLMVWKINT